MPHPTDADTVSADVALHCLAQDDRPMAFMTTLSYSAADPFAVGLTFHVPGAEVTWLVARDLLAAGLQRPAGEGDVLVAPTTDPDGRCTLDLEFRTLQGRLLTSVLAGDVRRFLERTYAAVPAGTEEIDVEALAAHLLA